MNGNSSSRPFLSNVDRISALLRTSTHSSAFNPKILEIELSPMSILHSLYCRDSIVHQDNHCRRTEQELGDQRHLRRCSHAIATFSAADLLRQTKTPIPPPTTQNAVRATTTAFQVPDNTT